MTKYKINLHAHSLFSCGRNSPYHMALEANSLNFSSLVITDYFDYKKSPTLNDTSLTLNKFKQLKKFCKEAKKVLPVILGMKLPIHNEEILLFGNSLISEIFALTNQGKNITVKAIQHLKLDHYSACILCNPVSIKNWEGLLPILDGYERYSFGDDLFIEDRDFGPLLSLPGWCNSGAPSSDKLSIGYNLVDTNITNEDELIKYIKSKRQPKHYLVKEREK